MADDSDLTTEFGINDVEILDNTSEYSGFLTIGKLTLRHRLYAGGWSDEIRREIVHRDPGVGVLLYDPDLDKVLMVEQFRAGCLDSPLHPDSGPWKIELVAGLIDTDESPEEVAIRETREEADVEIDHLFPICEYFLSPGSSSEYMHLFCARFNARKSAAKEGKIFGRDSENEDIRTVLMSRQDADKAVVDGIIDNAMTIIALQWLQLNLESVRQELAAP